MFDIGNVVKIKDTDNLEVQGELFSKETLDILKAVNFTGVITKIEDGLNYVGFSGEDIGWVTQVYKDEELEVVE